TRSSRSAQQFPPRSAARALVAMTLAAAAMAKRLVVFISPPIISISTRLFRWRRKQHALPGDCSRVRSEVHARACAHATPTGRGTRETRTELDAWNSECGLPARRACFLQCGPGALWSQFRLGGSSMRLRRTTLVLSG